MFASLSETLAILQHTLKPKWISFLIQGVKLDEVNMTS